MANTGPTAPKTFFQFVAAPFSDISVDKASGFLRGNFFFLLWILVVPLLMFGVKQGWELLYGLFDDTGPYPGLRAAAMLFVYYLLAMAIWLLPLPFFRKINPDTQEGLDEFNKLRRVTAGNPYRGLLVSALPMIFYSIAMIVVQAQRDFNWWYFALTMATIVGGIGLMWWVMEKSKLRIGRLQFLMGVNGALVFVLIWIGTEARVVFWNYYFIGMGMLIQMALLGGIFKHLEARLDPANPGLNRTHRRTYRFVFWTVITGTLVLSLINNLNVLSPTFVLLVIITCYVLLNDLLIAVYVLKKGKWLKYSLTTVLAILAWFIFIRKSEIHNINYVRSDLRAEDTRVDFHTYFKSWYDTNIAPHVDTTGTDSIPVYLVAAQGGGSRAGLWTSDLLNRMEVESDYRFHRHLFAVTSASGGSVGTGSTLSFWRFMQDNPGIDSASRSQMHDHFAAEMFKRNYLSSQFMQLFVNEVGKRFLGIFKSDVTDRNLEHQRHEALGFANAIRFGYVHNDKSEESPFERLAQTFAQGDADSLRIDNKHPKIVNYPMQPYLSYWYKAPRRPDARLPLYFPITLNIQTGKSGFSSPIAWDSTLFVDAIDILRDAENGKPGKTLAISTATNLSQLFPIMNSYTYIDNVGNFMDGGLFENMGLTLMSRIHLRLKEEIERSPDIPESVKKRLKIKILFFINDDIQTPEGTRFSRLNQTTATLKAVASSSIQGRNTWWVNYFNNILPPEDRPTTYVLQGPRTPEPDKLPLGRWLSRRSVEKACKEVDSLSIGRILEGLK